MGKLGVTAAVIALVATAFGPHVARAQRNAVPLVPAQRADPCGYRYAVWPVVQQTQDFAQNTEANDLGTINQDRGSYLMFKLYWLGVDYGQPKGMNKLSDAQIYVVVGAEKGLSLTKYMANMWAAVNALCPWKGKAFTWLGYLNAYGNVTTDTNTFRVPNNWRADYIFDCGGTPDSFMLVLYSASGQQLSIVTDRIRKTDNNTYTFKRGGSYSFRVITTCDWHVRVYR